MMTFEDLQKWCDEQAAATMRDITARGSTAMVVEIVVYDPAHGYPVRATSVAPHGGKALPIERWERPDGIRATLTGKNTDTPGKTNK